MNSNQNRNILINVDGATLEDVKTQDGHDYAICKTRDGAVFQFPIDDKEYLQTLRDNRGQQLDADVICHWENQESRKNRGSSTDNTRRSSNT